MEEDGKKIKDFSSLLNGELHHLRFIAWILYIIVGITFIILISVSYYSFIHYTRHEPSYVLFTYWFVVIYYSLEMIGLFIHYILQNVDFPGRKISNFSARLRIKYEIIRW